MIEEALDAEFDPFMKVLKAQQLMVFAPEFHSTSLARRTGERRLSPPLPNYRATEQQAVRGCSVSIALNGVAGKPPIAFDAASTRIQSAVDDTIRYSEPVMINIGCMILDS